MKFTRSFNNVPIRMLRKANETYYSGYDVATALNLQNKRKAVNEAVILNTGSIMEVQWEEEKAIFISTEYVVALAWKTDWDLAKSFILWIIEGNDVAKRFKSEVNEENTISNSYFATTQIAKRYGMSGIKLNEILKENFIQYKVNDKWVLFSKYQDLGLVKILKVKKKDDESVLHMYWTEKGLEFIEKLLDRLGYEQEGKQLSLF